MIVNNISVNDNPLILRQDEPIHNMNSKYISESKGDILSTDVDISLLGTTTSMGSTVLTYQDIFFAYGPAAQIDAYLNYFIIDSGITIDKCSVFTGTITPNNNISTLDIEYKGTFDVVTFGNYKKIIFNEPIYLRKGEYFFLNRLVWNVQYRININPQGSAGDNYNFSFSDTEYKTSKFSLQQDFKYVLGIVWTIGYTPAHNSDIIYSTNFDKSLLGYYTTNVNYDSSSTLDIVFLVGPAFHKNVRLQKLIFNKDTTLPRSTSIYICELTKTSDSSATINYNYIGSYNVNNIDNEYCSITLPSVEVKTGQYLGLTNFLFRDEYFIFLPEGISNHFISFPNDPKTSGSFVMDSAKLMKSPFNIIYSDDITINEQANLNNAFINVNMELRSTSNDNSLLGTITNIFDYTSYYNDNAYFILYNNFKKNAYLKSLTIEESLYSTIKLFLCNLTIKGEYTCIDYEYKGEYPAIKDGDYTQIVFEPYLYVEAGQYICLNRMPYLQTDSIIFNENSSSPNFISLPYNINDTIGSYWSPERKLLNACMHINYYDAISFDTIQNVRIVEKIDNYINILFFGNSLTQNAVQLVPWILHTLTPDLRFRIANYYSGGMTIAGAVSHVSTFPGLLSYSTNDSVPWRSLSSTEKITVLNEGFNHITIQEYTNIVSTFDEENALKLIWALRQKCGKSTKFHWLMEKTKTDNHQTNETEYERLKSFAKLAWEKLPISSLLNPGMAYMEALNDQTLHTVITSSVPPFTDYTHAQGGFPIYIQAANIVQWIYKEVLHRQDSILSDSLYLTQSIYSTLNIGDNYAGDGVRIFTTNDNYMLGQQKAQIAYNKIDAVKLGI